MITRSIILFSVFLFIGQIGQSQEVYLNVENFSSASITFQEKINTDALEFSPTFWNDLIVFVQSNNKDNLIDRQIGTSFFNLKFGAQNANNDIIKSAFFPKSINTDFHEGPGSFDDRNNFYYTSDNIKDGRLIKDDYGVVNLQIYTTTKENNDWKYPTKLAFCKNEFSYTHPAISATGDTLIFASNAPPSKGDMDLFITIKKGNTWSEPIRLSESINSPGNDWFPSIYKNYLFFASDKGGNDLDIFLTDLDSLNNVIRIPEPINSEFDDFGISINTTSNLGYFSSNRSNNDDIYKWEVDETIFDIKENPKYNFRFAIESKERVPYSIELKWIDADKIRRNDLNNWKLKDQYLLYDLKNIDFEGVLDTTIVQSDLSLYLEGEKIFFYSIMGEGFKPYLGSTILTNDDSISIKLVPIPKLVKPKPAVPKPIVKKILDIPVTRGAVIVFDNIYFEYGSHDLRSDAQIELDLLKEAMFGDPKIKVQLSAHTDARGSEQSNQILSDKRAQAAKSYLVRSGIESNRVYAIGFGESRLRNHCDDDVECSNEEHRFNRRVEVKILESK